MSAGLALLPLNASLDAAAQPSRMHAPSLPVCPVVNTPRRVADFRSVPCLPTCWSHLAAPIRALLPPCHRPALLLSLQVGQKLVALNLGWRSAFALLNAAYFLLHYGFAAQVRRTACCAWSCCAMHMPPAAGCTAVQVQCHVGAPTMQTPPSPHPTCADRARGRALPRLFGDAADGGRAAHHRRPVPGLHDVSRKGRGCRGVGGQ